MRSRIVVTVLCTAIVVSGYLYLMRPRLLSRDEELFADILSKRCAVMKNPRWALLTFFVGSEAMKVSEARLRVLRYVMHEYPSWEIIDGSGMIVDSNSGVYKVPGTQRTAEFATIEIVKWRSDEEVVVRWDFAQGGLAGGGGEFVMVKRNGIWAIGEVLAKMVH